LIDECLRLGERLPDSILNAPTLEKHLSFYLDAFWELSSERQIGFGEGVIPITAILNYASHYDFNSEEEHDLVFLIRKQDEAYLKYRKLQEERKKKK